MFHIQRNIFWTLRGSSGCRFQIFRASSNFYVSSEIRDAVETNRPVVALESAIISHGMPYPNNIDIALRLEKIIRNEGVVPATIGVIEGKVKVGLTEDDIQFLGSKNKKSVKVSRRDFPTVMSQKSNGGTTVAGTIIAATKAKIPIFATGGIGGVHRGAEMTFDISSDLRELGRQSIAVVSAGIKSILDIGKTLEYLETEGVCVCVLDKKLDDVKFPSFFTAESNFEAPIVLRNEMEGAYLIHSATQFKLGSGILIAVPIPKEYEVASNQEIEKGIESALSDARRSGISGKSVTPYLLSALNNLTQGKSLGANEKLIENNVMIASKIAVELSKLRIDENSVTNTSQVSPLSVPTNKRRDHLNRNGFAESIVLFKEDTKDEKMKKEFSIRLLPKESQLNEPLEAKDVILPSVLSKGGRPVVIGGSCLDIVMAIREDQILEDGRTLKGEIKTVPGGVGRNVAEALKKLGQNPFLITTVGKDAFGRCLLDNFDANGLDKSGIDEIVGSSTPIYSAILNSRRECHFGIGDMDLHSKISVESIHRHKNVIGNASIVLIDGNLPIETIQTTLDLCGQLEVPVWFEPTEVRKAKKILQVPQELWSSLTFLSPNFRELETLTRTNDDDRLKIDPKTIQIQKENLPIVMDDIKTLLVSQCFRQFSGLQVILLTLGSQGFMVVHRQNPIGQGSTWSAKWFPPSSQLTSTQIQSVSGAGDCLNAGFISGLLNGSSITECSRLATKCAEASLLSLQNVPDKF